MVLWQDLQLAWRNIQLHPLIAALVVAVIAVGIASSVIAITLYHARAGNPIWWKAENLYRVLLDSRPARHDVDNSRHPEYPPFTLIYRDAAALQQSPIPAHSVMTLASYGLVDPMQPGRRPFDRPARLTTRDFFAMFDVPFLYGHAWSKTDDEEPSPIVVISRYLSERLFGAGNPVGRVLSFSGHEFTILGVIDTWLPTPRFYDVGKGFMPSDDLFFPFKWADSLTDLEYPGFCERTQTSVTKFKELASSDCVVVGMWVELSGRAQLQQYRSFVDAYAREQQHASRFERPLNNRIVDVPTWLRMNEVVGNQSEFQVVLALIFLAVCILNTLGLLLAKFLVMAPITGLRRALGATRADIVRQHVVEVLVLGLAAGGLGIGLALVGLRLIREFLLEQSQMSGEDSRYATVAQSMSHLDGTMLLVSIGLSVIAGILAGLYPAWRIGRMAPATFLKIQ